tara:strand:+ start:254 stop:538 length:285 start_codon:yes stop_codon:yes gene_type:complete
MALKTIPFREIEKYSENMYEAVAAMSGQARKELDDRIMEESIKEVDSQELDVFDEVPDIKPEEYIAKEKIATIAVNKFLDGEVTWRKVDTFKSE